MAVPIEPNQSKSVPILDKISFKQVFFFWVLYMFVFGCIYYLFSFTASHGLLYKGTKIGTGISDFFISQYFSFITAASASQGYGDIFPFGLSRFFAVIEAVSGLIIFGIIISKLLSQKQEILLQEMYTISFDERIHRLRSALALFRSDVSKLIDKIENNSFSQRRIHDLWITFTSLESTLYASTKMMQPNEAERYVQSIDDFNLELVLNSVGMSLAKARDLISLLNNRQIIWHNNLIHSTISTMFISVINMQKLVRKRDPNPGILEKMDDVVALAEQLRHQTLVVVRADASSSD